MVAYSPTLAIIIFTFIGEVAFAVLALHHCPVIPAIAKPLVWPIPPGRAKNP